MLLNDYEIIYLIRSENDEIALKHLITKYEKMIYKIIHQSGVEKKYHEDFYQEAIILLAHIVQTFDEYKDKSFTRFFELVLKRRFQRLKQKNDKFILIEFLGQTLSRDYRVNHENGLILNEKSSTLSSIEKVCYKLYFIKHLKPKEIARVLEMDIKKVYNLIYALKRIK